MEATLEEPIVEEPVVVKVDVRVDISDPQSYPWPYDDDSVDELACGGVLEYIPGKERGKFMDEIYRILKPKGTAAIAVPYWNTWRAVYDFRLEWPPFCEQSFLIFNKEWREANHKWPSFCGDSTDLICDVDYTYGYSWEPETAARHEESRSFYTKHYTNCVDALHLMLTKRTK